MLAVVHSATIIGIDGFPVRVEVHVASGLPMFSIVGLPDASCRESRDRVRAAIVSSGFKWPDQRITVNLAPTNLRKSGSGLDVAIAVGILAASEQLNADRIESLGFVGELGLDGALRPVVGMLALVHALIRPGEIVPVVSPGNHHEAMLINSDTRAASSLCELVDSIQGKAPWMIVEPALERARDSTPVPDVSDVHGQLVAKRALEVAAAGGHHILMIGPPGSGKTMLAERVPTLMPDLDEESAFEVSRVHSAAGIFSSDDLLRRPPFRAPHHSASLVALIGGGSTALRPGEVSLASDGVLFLDELGEYPAVHLDALRQPLESGRIHIARAMVSTVLPARFLLVAATNPCPCGMGRWGECRCSQASLARYARRLSGPLLDRFDIRIAVEPPRGSEVLTAKRHGPTSSEIRQRVTVARQRAVARGVRVNRELRAGQIDEFAPLESGARRLLRSALEEGALSMRGAQRLRILALTIKDLEGESGAISDTDLMEAMMLRGEGQLVGLAS